MSTPATLPHVIELGREICTDLAAAESCEWLVTNGLGGFGCGTVAGTLTRRYHGLLVAALPSPWNRTLLVSKFDETVEYAGQSYALGANRWVGGAIDPTGYLLIESFRLEGTIPVWTFACGDARLEKRIWMEHGANTTYVRYTVAQSRGPLMLAAKVMVTWRGYHGLTRGQDRFMDVQAGVAGLTIQADAGAPPFYILSNHAKAEPAHTWYRNYELTKESSRGLDHVEDHLHAGTFRAELKAGESVTLTLSTSPEATLDGAEALTREISREAGLLGQCAKTHRDKAAWPAGSSSWCLPPTSSW